MRGAALGSCEMGVPESLTKELSNEVCLPWFVSPSEMVSQMYVIMKYLSKPTMFRLTVLKYILDIDNTHV